VPVGANLSFTFEVTPKEVPHADVKVVGP
jgi:hypothetical protein